MVFDAVRRGFWRYLDRIPVGPHGGLALLLLFFAVVFFVVMVVWVVT